MRPLIVIITAFAAACAPVVHGAPGPVSPDNAVVSVGPVLNEAACRAEGGVWEPVCRLQESACVIKFADGGRTCTDSDQCRGECYAAMAQDVGPGESVTGRCAFDSNPCGCRAMVEDGRASPVLCVD